MIPTLLLTPGESRGRAGVIVPDVSGIVDVAADAWRLWKGLGNPAVIITPDDVRDRNGPLALRSGAHLLEIVEGKYGPAWRTTATNSFAVVGATPELLSPEITVFTRWIPSDQVSGYFWAMGTYGGEMIGVLQYSGGSGIRMIYQKTGVTRATVALTRAQVLPYFGEMASVAWRGTPSGQKLWFEDVEAVSPGAYEPNAAMLNTNFGFGAISRAVGMISEGVVAFDRALPDDEVRRILNLPHAWTWSPDGTITAPHPEPLGSVLVRYRAAGVVHTAHLVGPGTFGTHGTVSHHGDTLTIGTTRDIELLGVVVYKTALSEAEVQRVTDMARWGWDDILHRPHIAVSRVQRPKRVAVARIQQQPRIAVARSQRP